MFMMSLRSIYLDNKQYRKKEKTKPKWSILFLWFKSLKGKNDPNFILEIPSKNKYFKILIYF